MDIGLGDSPMAHRNAGIEYRLAITADQWMPRWQLFSLGNAPIGACFGQPAQFVYVAGIEMHTIGHQDMTEIIICTSAGVGVEQIAGHPGVIHLPGGGIL